MKKLAAVCIVLSMLCALVSCTGAKPAEPLERIALAIVLGAHAGSHELNFANTHLKDTVKEIMDNDGFISVISSEGRPRVVQAKRYEILKQYRKASPEKLENDAIQRTQTVLASLEKVRAQTAEVDTLEALNLAVRTFASAPGSYRRVILVIDTGLSTTGLLDFRNGLLDTSPAVIAAALAEKQAIPDFSGTRVLWQQLGDVAEPQPRLDRENKTKLKNIWSAIIARGGGYVDFSDIVALQGVICARSNPPVSVVPVPAEQGLRFDPQTPTVFAEENIRFIADKATYADPKAVRACLQPVAKYFMENSEFRALLVGTTAGVENKDACFKLSRERAEAVKETLVDLGASPHQIRTVGLADTDPWHIPDRGVDGRLVEEYATLNRKVVLLDASSPEARSILVA